MTARYRPYNPEEGYFTLIDPEDIKEHNPLLKAIYSFVEEHISVEPFSESIKNEVEGAPAVHPRMMLKVIFYSYAQGIYS
jgi:transposase